MGEFDQIPDSSGRVKLESDLPSPPPFEGLTPVSGKYNQFQRTMLQWSGLHPYNAVHVVRIAGTIELDHFEKSLNHVLNLSGLANLSINPKSGRFTLHGGNPACHPRLIEGNGDPLPALYREMTRQLNEPFPFETRFTPFRFFLLRSAGESFAGITYFHAVADAESITRLLLEIVRACFDPAPGPIRDETLRPRGDGKLPTASPLSALRRSWSAITRIRSMRMSFRPPLCKITDLHNDISCISLDREHTAVLLSTAREWGLTINDLCLAALLLAIAPLAPEVTRGSRPHLSVGCVVNLRGDLALRKRNFFGLFLGSFAVSHAVPEGISLRDLAHSVREQTLAIKKRKLYFASALEFLISRFMFERMTKEKQCNFYRKSYPLWGSITNMKMDGLCNTFDVAPIRDYYRAVSAGPAMPLVIAVTGVDGHLNFGASFRPAILPASEVGEIMERIIGQLKAVGGKA